MVPWVLNAILSKYIPSQNPHVRQAACVWLLSLVKKLSQHKEIKVGLAHGLEGRRRARLRRWKDGLKCLSFKSIALSLSPSQCHLKEIQSAFISILSDPDGEAPSTPSTSAHPSLPVISSCVRTPPTCVEPYLLLSFSRSFRPSSADLSQDVASKGLGLVYEMGEEGDQQELVSTLVETLMTGKR